VRGEFLDVGGVRLYGYAAGDRGDRPPVVLLHGFPTSSHLWADVVPLLAERERVYVLDLLGFGRSDCPGDRPLSVRAHAERVVALLDLLRVERASVVGHELGAAVALQLALRWPARVAHLGVASAAAFDCWPVRELKLARAMLPLTRHLPPNWLLSLLRGDLARGYADPERGARSIGMYLRPFAGADGRAALTAHLAALDAAEVEALTARAREVVAPSAVIWGERDPFLAADVGRRLHAALPGSTLHVVPDARHFVPEEAPEQVADAITALLAR
jgi:pimeloyl-ACP methyl ester carboxylesterase